MTCQCLEQCWILKESQDWNLHQSEGSKNPCVGELKACKWTWKTTELHEGQLTLEWWVWNSCMANLTPKVKVILGPKHQEYRVGSLHLNSWILSQSGLQVATDAEVSCFRLTVQGKRLVACVVLTDPSWFWLSLLTWSQFWVRMLFSISNTVGLLHFHLNDLTQLLEGGIEGFQLSWGSTMEILVATNTFKLPFFEAFMKGFDWKMIETCTQKYEVSQKDLLFAPFYYFFSVSFSFSLGISWK